MQQITGALMRNFKFQGFEASLHSSKKGRTPLELEPHEKMLLAKIEETVSDRSLTGDLVERMRQHFISFHLL
jgi:hypothetical protein